MSSKDMFIKQLKAIILDKITTSKCSRGSVEGMIEWKLNKWKKTKIDKLFKKIDIQTMNTNTLLSSPV